MPRTVIPRTLTADDANTASICSRPSEPFDAGSRNPSRPDRASSDSAVRSLPVSCPIFHHWRDLASLATMEPVEIQHLTHGPAIAFRDDMTIHGDADHTDMRCAELDEMTSQLLCTTSISRCLKAARSISSRIRCSRRVVALALGLTHSVQTALPQLRSMPIAGTKPFPESITSTSDGALFIGRVGDGGIVCIKPRTAERTVFVKSGEFGSRSIMGVFADEAANTLWACSNNMRALGGPATGHDTSSALKGFDLKGVGKRSISLPRPHAFCNDITMDSKGSVYVTDSANPTVLVLSPGATGFEEFASSQQF